MRSTALVGPLSAALFLVACDQGPVREFVGMRDNIVDAKYSQALEKIVLVGTSLGIADSNGVVQEIELPWDGCGVSVFEDHAAVSHDGFFSLVDLRLGEVKATKEVNTRCPEVLLGPDHVYVLSRGRKSRPSFYAPRSTLELANAFRSGIEGRGEIHQSGRRIYGVEPGSIDTVRYSLKADGTPASHGGYDSIYHYDFPICPDVWLAKDGKRLFNACGSVFTTRGRKLRRGRVHDSPSPEYDQIHLGRLPVGNRLRSLCDNGRVLVVLPGEEAIQDTVLSNHHFPKDLPFYDVDSVQALILGSHDFELVQELSLPQFPKGPGAPDSDFAKTSTRAEYAFCPDSESAILVVSTGPRHDRWGLIPILFVDQR